MLGFKAGSSHLARLNIHNLSPLSLSEAQFSWQVVGSMHSEVVVMLQRTQLLQSAAHNHPRPLSDNCHATCCNTYQESIY